MAEIIKETVVTQGGNVSPVITPVEIQNSQTQTIEYLIYFFFGVLEVLLVFRLVLKLLGASQASAFVRFIYGLSGIFVFPFEGIFRRVVTDGIETASVLEPATVVALIVYSLLCFGIVKLLRVLSGVQEVS